MTSLSICLACLDIDAISSNALCTNRPLDEFINWHYLIKQSLNKLNVWYSTVELKFGSIKCIHRYNIYKEQFHYIM